VSVAPRIFLLSPASCRGKRAGFLFNPAASFDVAVRLRAGQASIAEVFSFLSGLYFRGKVGYARCFARPPAGLPGVLVITPNEGIRLVDEAVDVARLRGFAAGDIDLANPAYREPLLRDARTVATVYGAACEIVLLGSVASGKYVEALGQVFGPRLLFPVDFAGRGDMSRGGLLLRCIDSGQELACAPVSGGAARHGPRPPRLAPRRRASPSG
jgi:hypothetical protein